MRHPQNGSLRGLRSAAHLDATAPRSCARGGGAKRGRGYLGEVLSVLRLPPHLFLWRPSRAVHAPHSRTYRQHGPRIWCALADAALVTKDTVRVVAAHVPSTNRALPTDHVHIHMERLSMGRGGAPLVSVG